MEVRIKLNSGTMMPMLGLGTFRSMKENVKNAVNVALTSNYRLIDTAACYRNEKEIGEELQSYMKENNLKREDLFITSKLAPIDQGYEKAKDAFNRTLENLKLNYIDLYLIHWPGAGKISSEDPRNKLLRLESWKVLEEFYYNGKAKAIGVSNYGISHLQELVESDRVVPAVNQVEYHPKCMQKELKMYCDKHNIVLQAYSSFGVGELLKEDSVMDIVKETENKTAAQVLLRWAYQKGVPTIPKSTTTTRIIENSNIFNFKLNDKQMQKLDLLNTDHHYCWDSKLIK